MEAGGKGEEKRKKRGEKRKEEGKRMREEKGGKGKRGEVKKRRFFIKGKRCTEIRGRGR